MLGLAGVGKRVARLAKRLRTVKICMFLQLMLRKIVIRFRRLMRVWL